MLLRRVTLSFVLVALGVAGCGDATSPGEAAEAAEAASLPSDQVIYELRHIMTRDGVREAVLEGDSAFLRESDGWLDITGVQLEFFAESGANSGNLTSRTGEYDMRNGSFVARGNVVLRTRTPQGERILETEELHYDVAGGELWSDVDFVLREGGRTTRGTSFRSDAQFQSWSVQGARTAGGLPEAPGQVSF